MLLFGLENGGGSKFCEPGIDLGDDGGGGKLGGAGIADFGDGDGVPDISPSRNLKDMISLPNNTIKYNPSRNLKNKLCYHSL